MPISPAIECPIRTGHPIAAATTVNGVTTYLVYDAFGNMVAEYGGTTSAGSVQYVFTDLQISTRMVMDKSAAITARHDYYAFGEDIGVVG